MANDGGPTAPTDLLRRTANGWSASGDMVRRLRRRGTPWSQPAWVGATGEGGMLLIGEMASATAGEANRTPCRSHTARNTGKDKATTPRTASSSAESSTDTTATSTSTRTASPEDMITRGSGITLRAGAAGAGAGAFGSCSRQIHRLICRLDNFPMDRGTLSRRIIPTTTDTWDTRGGGQQRGIGIAGRYGFCHPPDDRHYFQP